MKTQIEYYNSIKTKGLKDTWEDILNNFFPNEYFTEDKLGGLYEEGLALENKITKKEMGKYYTPDDVANVMADYLLTLNGDNICDLCCGTGNLILSVLNILGREKALEKLENGFIHLYDIDETAMNIAVAIIKNRYGDRAAKKVNKHCGDWIANNIVFPSNAKIISNPPYGANPNLTTTNGNLTHEMYIEFMEKIINSNLPAVIITPHSFMGGDSFKNFRKLLSTRGGKIFSFDNVPGNIFNGRKFGIFNSNEANSTRAAITILDPNKIGYQVSPFIRFLSAERSKLLSYDTFESLLPSQVQIPSNGEILYRVEIGTDEVVNKWLSSSKKLSDLLVDSSYYKVNVPNSCRYYLSCTKRILSRSGKYELYFKDEESFYLGYAFLNSSLGYYYQRICNGGVTYPIGLLKSMPIFGEVNDELKNFVDKMIQEEAQYITIKMNAGAPQENIKFPLTYTEELNKILLKNIGIDNINLLKVHQNSNLV